MTNASAVGCKSVSCSQNGTPDIEWSLSNNKNTPSARRTNLLPEIICLRQMKEYAANCGKYTA